MTSQSIKTWVKSHTLQETQELIAGGETVTFLEDGFGTENPMILTVLQAAFILYEAEKERRSGIAKTAYHASVAAGRYAPRLYLGYEPYTFLPSVESAERRIVRTLFRKAAAGESLKDLTDFMNKRGYHTVNSNPQTTRSIRSLLQNPVYVGDVVFQKAGVILHNHHRPLISRVLWEAVQKRLAGIKEEPVEQAA